MRARPLRCLNTGRVLRAIAGAALLAAALAAPARAADSAAPEKTRTVRVIMSTDLGAATGPFQRDLGWMLAFRSRFFPGSVDFYLGQGSIVGVTAWQSRDWLRGGARTLRRQQFIDAVVSVGYWNEGLRHVAIDLSLGATVGFRAWKNGHARLPVFGIVPSLMIALPATARYNLGLTVTPHFVFGSKRLLRESSVLAGVSFVIKMRNRVTELPWRE